MSKNRAFLFTLTSLLVLATSCAGVEGLLGKPKKTPPGANSVGGGVEDTRFFYHYWDEGLAVLIWHDLAIGGQGCSGSGSTEDELYRLDCDIDGSEGQSLNFQIHTGDGITADMWIDGQSYDLSRGNLFLVRAQESPPEIVQLQRDLSNLGSSVEAVSALAISDPDIAAFVESARPQAEPADTPGPEPVDAGNEGPLDQVLASFKDAGLSVMDSGTVNQPFFSVAGQVMSIGGHDVQFFDYPDGASARTEAALIAPDAGSVGGTMVTWIATPHFYRYNNLVALYTGDDVAFLQALEEVLGPPIAEGEAISPPEPDAVSLILELLADGDYASLEPLLGDPFIIGYWLSEGQSLAPAEVIPMLETNLLPDPESVTFTRDREQFPDLGGVDPVQLFGPDAGIVDLAYSQGWGNEALGEAILTFAEDADGQLFWHGLIYSSLPFADFSDQPAPRPAYSFEPAIYRNEENGFEIDYPAMWTVDEQVLGTRASGAQFYENGDFVMAAIVYLWDPRNDLDAYVNHWRDGWTASGIAILSEEELAIGRDWRVIRFELQTAEGDTETIFFTEVGDRYLQIAGPNENGVLDEVISSLRSFG